MAKKMTRQNRYCLAWLTEGMSWKPMHRVKVMLLIRDDFSSSLSPFSSLFPFENSLYLSLFILHSQINHKTDIAIITLKKKRFRIFKMPIKWEWNMGPRIMMKLMFE